MAATEKELQEAKQRVAELEAELNRSKGAEPYWKPAIGEEIYFIGTEGLIKIRHFSDSQFERDMLKQGNIFKTREEAEKISNIRACEERLREAVWYANGGKFVEFKLNNDNLAIDLYNGELEVSHGNTIKAFPDWQYFISEEAAQECREEHHDDWLMLRNA